MKFKVKIEIKMDAHAFNVTEPSREVSRILREFAMQIEGQPNFSIDCDQALYINNHEVGYFGIYK